MESLKQFMKNFKKNANQKKWLVSGIYIFTCRIANYKLILVLIFNKVIYCSAFILIISNSEPFYSPLILLFCSSESSYVTDSKT